MGNRNLADQLHFSFGFSEWINRHITHIISGESLARASYRLRDGPVRVHRWVDISLCTGWYGLRHGQWPQCEKKRQTLGNITRYSSNSISKPDQARQYSIYREFDIERRYTHHITEPSIRDLSSFTVDRSRRQTEDF